MRLETELLKKIKKNRKQILKEKILEIVETKHLTSSEIKDIIVDQARYCSKASFYRYLEELANYKYIDFADKGGRTVVILGQAAISTKSQ